MPEANIAADATRFNFEALFDTPAGEELPTDGPDNDRTGAALEARVRSYQQADDLNWLMEGTEETGSRRTASTAAASESEGGGLKGLAAAAAEDAGMGLVESPTQAVGGMRDAVQSMLDLADTAADWAESKFSLGGVQLVDENGNFFPQYLGPDAWAEAQEAGLSDDPQLPSIREPHTMTGSAIRSVSQFMRYG